MTTLIKACMLSVIILSGISAIAQSIKGTVTSEGSPIPSASVSVKPTGKGTTTDNNGSYRITLSPGSYSITFSATGFQEETKNVTVAAGDDKTVDVVLSVMRLTLEDIVLTGSRALPRSSANTPLPDRKSVV